MKSRVKLGCFVVVLILAIITAVLISNYISTQGKVNKAGEYVLSALKTKYQKDFVIEKGHYIANTGGYEFTVYPKDDPEFTFNAWLNGMTESGESDEYLIMQEKNEGKQMIAPYIKAISEDYYISAISVSPYTALPDIDKLLSDMYNNQRSIAYMLDKYPEKMRIAVNCHINYNITINNENSVLKKVYNLIEFLRKRRFGYISIDIFFYDMQGKNLHFLDMKYGVNFGKEYFNDTNYRILITEKDSVSVKSWKVIKNHLLRKKSNIEGGRYAWEQSK